MTATRPLLAAFAARRDCVPSLAQPPADQGLFGRWPANRARPHRDAWDRSPGIHFTYAAMLAIWPRESTIPGADLLVAMAIAALLFAIGRHAARTAGEAAALIFLALSNPAVTRFGGVRVRAQCGRSSPPRSPRPSFCAIARGARQPSLHAGVVAFLRGVAIGAVVFSITRSSLAVPACIWIRRCAGAGVGARGRRCAMVAAMAAFFATRGAWRDRIDATVIWQHALRRDLREWAHPKTVHVPLPSCSLLWFLGGVSCVVLLAGAVWSPRLLIVPVWAAAACLSIAINGNRDRSSIRPGRTCTRATPASRIARLVAAVAIDAIVIVLVSIAVWRITDRQRGLRSTTIGMRGGVDRETYLRDTALKIPR
jgi:hypothetical protein